MVRVPFVKVKTDCSIPGFSKSKVKTIRSANGFLDEKKYSFFFAKATHKSELCYSSSALKCPNLGSIAVLKGSPNVGYGQLGVLDHGMCTK